MENLPNPDESTDKDQKTKEGRSILRTLGDQYVFHLLATLDVIKVNARGEKDRESNDEGRCPTESQRVLFGGARRLTIN